MLEQIDNLTGGRAPIAIAAGVGLLALVAELIVRSLQPLLAKRAGARIALYLATAARTGAVTVAVLGIVFALAIARGERDLWVALSDFGLNVRFAADVGAVLTVAMVAAGAAVSAAIGLVRRSFGGAPERAAIEFLPVTPAETAIFTLLLAPIGSAGEEVIFRGFLIGQFWAFTGDGWIAAVLSSTIFGLAHRYQGPWGMLRTGLIGFAFAVGVLLTGSLVPSIVAHFIANALGASFRPPANAAAKAAP